MDETAGTPDFTALTAEVVSAYVANNSLRPADIPDLIESVHRAMQGLSAPPKAEPEKREPPVSIKKSITPDFLISLEDGKRYKTLRRHLTAMGLPRQDQIRAVLRSRAASLGNAVGGLGRRQRPEIRPGEGVSTSQKRDARGLHPRL